MMLSNLPSEILQNVFRFLPSTDALQMLLVCKTTNQVCNHWLFWYDLFVQKLSSKKHQSIPKEAWKQYVYIDSILEQADFSKPLPIESFRWLPWVIALQRKLLLCTSSNMIQFLIGRRLSRNTIKSCVVEQVPETCTSNQLGR